MSIKNNIQDALANNDVDKSDLDLSAIESALADFIHLDERLNVFANPDNQKALSFVRLAPRKFSPRHLYGTHVKTDHALELSVCPAILNDKGEWIADEANAYIKALTTQRGLTDAVFSTSRHGGNPITYTEIQGQPVNYEPSVSFYDQLFHRIEKKALKNKDWATNMLEEAKGLNKADVKLTKANKAVIKETVINLLRYVQNEGAFDADLAKEHLQKQMQDIKGEILSGITNAVMDTAEPLLLGNNLKAGDNLFLDCFRMFGKTNNQDDIGELIKRHADTFTDYQDKEKAKSIRYSVNHITNRNIRKLSDVSEPSQGLLDIGHPCGGRPYFFGDSSSVNTWFTFDFQFAAHELNEYGELRYYDNVSALEVYLTEFQLMNLLQSSTTGAWIKCTLCRILGTGIPLPKEDDIAEHDPLRSTPPKESEHTAPLKALLNELDDLLKGSSTAQKTKVRILELSEEIATLFEVESQDKLNKNKENMIDMTEQHIKSSEGEILTILEKIEEKHPQIKQRLHKMLPNLL